MRVSVYSKTDILLITNLSDILIKEITNEIIRDIIDYAPESSYSLFPTYNAYIIPKLIAIRINERTKVTNNLKIFAFNWPLNGPRGYPLALELL